ncbi:MAG: hypothetical protein ACYTG3_14735 [Planctomycetota bacterium]
MRKLLTLLAVVALVVGAGCGDKESASTQPDGPAMKTPPAKTGDITYTCATPDCPKEKTQAADLPPPS